MNDIFRIFVLMPFFLIGLQGKAQAERDLITDTLGSNFLLRELRYGRIDGERIGRYPNSNSPTGTSGVLGSYEFLSLTDTIPAGLGVSFGAELVLESESPFLEVPLTVVWRFPSDIVNPVSSKRYNHVSHESYGASGQLMLSSYKFDEDYEVKSGIWTLEVYHQSKLIYSRQFLLLRDI